MAGSINIKNVEAVRLLNRLRAATGKGASELVLEALREKAERDARLRDVEGRVRRVQAIVKRAAKKMKNKHLTDEEIVGYDEDGLPA